MTRTITAVVLTCAALAVPIHAQQRTSPPPSVDAGAIKALNSMAVYLRNLKSYEVESVATTDEVLDIGQTVQYASTITFLVQMPNKLMADQTSDRAERRYVYDGKTFTLWARRIGYYATVAAPPTVPQLDDMLQDTYGIELPLADLFRFGLPRWNAADIKSAIDLGPAEVGGATCEHYALRQDDVDWQIWIQKGDHPLPRKLAITTTTNPARPQHSAVFTWNLAPSFNDAAFTFVPPAGVKKIVLAPVDQQ
jgi:hypothetical protein